MSESLSDVDPRIEDGAVKVYENDIVDDFPVLKAFQQYIDSEQAKARRRIAGICIVFSFLLTVVISVFVILLILSSSRNQSLNDRLVEYAMKDRTRIEQPQPIVQPMPQQDNSAILALTKKLEDLRTELTEERARSAKSAVEAAKAAALEKKKSAEELEIERLKALLAAEKEKAAAEREKQRQAELEAYRRKHYPELYEKPARKTLKTEVEEADREIESILKDIKPIDYFDEEPDTKKPPEKKAETKKTKKDGEIPFEATKAPKDIKDEVGNTWEIPTE